MSEAKFESILRELRETAPLAPERLRDRVRALPGPGARRSWRLRPALAAAVVIAVAVGLGAAAIEGLKSSTTSNQASPAAKAPGIMRELAPATEKKGDRSFSGQLGASSSGVLAPTQRLQQHSVSMAIRVRDLSRATQTAVRTTRRLDGYVANADYSTSGSTGDSLLELRVPVQRVQQAISSFTDLGTILSQRIDVADLQASVDRVDRSLTAAQKLVTELAGRTALTPTERARLDAAKRTIARLSQRRTRLVRDGTYAKVSLSLTTQKPAAKHVAPGRFDRFRGVAGDILGKEAIIVLYALVVAGPFVLLAALALLAERTRRRRADSRLLQEAG
jgi:hypothetical protein